MPSPASTTSSRQAVNRTTPVTDSGIRLDTQAA